MSTQAPGIGWIKFTLYAFAAVLIASLIFKIYKKIFSIFKTESEEAQELGQNIPSGIDYMGPNDFLSIKLPAGKKPSDIVDFQKVTGAAIDFYLSYKNNDKVRFITALKKLQTKYEVATAARILFNQYKVTLQFIAENFKLYDYAKNYIYTLKLY